MTHMADQGNQGPYDHHIHAVILLTDGHTQTCQTMEELLYALADTETSNEDAQIVVRSA